MMSSKFLPLVIIPLALLSCTTQQAGTQTFLESKCVRDAEIIVASDTNAIDTPVDVRLCYSGRIEVIEINVRGKQFSFRDQLHVGARVRFEYHFRVSRDLLLVTYGYDNIDIPYDYALYEIEGHGAIKSGKSENRPRLLDLL
jgi:hypothetical protein